MAKIKKPLIEDYVPLSKGEIKDAIKEARRSGSVLSAGETREVKDLPLGEIRSDLEFSNPGLTIKNVYVKRGSIVIEYKGKGNLDLSPIGKYTK